MRRFAAVALALLAGCSAEGDDVVRIVSADDPLPDDLVAGDVIERSGIAVTVPEPGKLVQVVAEFDDGTSIELTVSNPIDGPITLVEAPIDLDDSIDVDVPDVLAANATAPCQDGAFHTSGFRWKTRYEWNFWADSTPAANSKANVELGLQHAASAITTSRNDCGFADQVSATHKYLGRTGAGPNMRTANGVVTCTGTDNQNVVGFGALPSGVLGVACTWFDGNGAALEGDIRLASKRSWFALDVPAGCSNRVGVQAVATHEFGHVFGLGHVSESAHPNLTMSTAAASCSNAPFSLGLGDVRALRKLY